MAIRPILLHIYRVVALGKDGGVVVGVLNVDVDEHARGEDRGALVDCLDLKHWGKENYFQICLIVGWRRHVFGQEGGQGRLDGWVCR